MEFDYRTADSEAIQAKAQSFIGRTLIELQPALAPMVPSSASTKGIVGRIYEASFGIPQNSIPGPDFPGAAIELKSVPVLIAGAESRAKERISVGMIDFEGLALEAWDTANVRKKLERILLIFYRWEPLRPIASFQTVAAGIWHPSPTTWAAIRADWESVRDLIVAGRRNDVSESYTRVLGAATKGPGHGSRTRAWSLKQPFVTSIYREMTGAETAPEPPATADPAAAFERVILARLEPFVGQSLAAIAVAVGRVGKGGKAAGAQNIRALLGARANGKQGDFARFGIEIKTVPIGHAGVVLESMSFPAFVHEELAFETWEDSDLLGRLNRLLIVPIHRGRRVNLAESTLGRPFFWSPTEGDLSGIAVEWERYRRLIQEGEARRLPPASDTTYIHVRPKSRNAADTDPAPGGFDVTKKCFWLNQRYVERILDAHEARQPA